MTATQQPLLAQIDEAEDRLGGFENELRAVDGELSTLATRREQHRLLEQTCASLEALAQLGAGGEFWGPRLSEAEADVHVREVRARLADFAQQVRVTEDKRQSILDHIAQGSEVLAILEGDLQDIQEEEFQKSLEWTVERELGPVPDGPQLPWARGGDDDLRLRKSLGSSLLVAGLVAVLLPLVKIPLPDITQVEKVPERIVRFIELDVRRPAPTPPPAVEQRKPKEKELVAEQKKNPEPKAAAPVEEAKPVESPRQRAQAAGLLAFRESLAPIAERRAADKLGAMARVGNTGERYSGPAQRSLITSLVPGSSGGINTAALSRDVGGGGGGNLDGVEVGRVADAIGGAPNGKNGAAGPRAGDGGLAGRTDEEIQIVFDRYKAGLYRMYNRELRNDPSLRGQVVLRLTIEPDGSVSMCKLQSTDMNAPALAEQVVERVKTFAFGAKDVAAVTIVYPIDFLPAA